MIVNQYFETGRASADSDSTIMQSKNDLNLERVLFSLLNPRINSTLLIATINLIEATQ